jgi:hypothetical protein
MLELRESSNKKLKASTIASFSTLVCPAKLDFLAINAVCSSTLNEFHVLVDASRKLEPDATSSCVGAETLLNFWENHQ